MKKTLYTLNVDNYAPEICSLTWPLLRRYAEKVGAEFFVISERKYSEWPPVYEKLQIHSLAKERGDYLIYYIDSDALVHPDFFDVTEHLSRDTVCHNGIDMAGCRWRYDDYFRRDGRHIGSCNWFTIASSWCRDLWTPLTDLTFAEALERIFPTQEELASVVTREHLIDDYTLSRNIARFGLKCKTVVQMQRDLGDQGNYLWHQYLLNTEQKVAAMHEVLTTWKVTP